MRRALILICVGLALVVLGSALAGCGEKTVEPSGSSQTSVSPRSAPGGDQSDVEWLKAYINKGSSVNPDFDHNSFERISFAEDGQGNRWAFVETNSFYKSQPDKGLYEAHVFEKVNGQWKRVAGGSGGYSDGVPPEVQKEWGIEGR